MPITQTETFASPSLESLRQAPETVAGILRDFGEQRSTTASKLEDSATFDPSSPVSQQAMKDALDVQKNVALAKLEDAQNETQDRFARAQADIASALTRSAPADATERLLRELQEQRLWGRTRQVLDSAGSAGDVETAVRDLVDAAVADGDEDAIFALRAELPAYLLARGMAGGTGIVAKQALDEALAAVRPKAAAALEARRELERGSQLLAGAFNQAVYSVEQDESNIILPGWTKNEVVRVEL